MPDKIVYKYPITLPFAENGQKESIPQYSETTEMSYAQGYTPAYSTKPADGGRYINRLQTNYLHNQEQNAIKEIQEILNGSGSVAKALEARKLTTPRTITITGTINGSATFDGSANIEIQTTGGGNPIGNIPIGMPFPLINGSILSNQNDNKYIVLSAGESGVNGFNYGLIANETVANDTGYYSGFKIATATITCAGSPLNNTVIRLINTEQRYLRASTTVSVYGDAIRNIEGYTGTPSHANIVISNPFYIRTDAWETDYRSGEGINVVYMNLARSTPTSAEVKPRTLSLLYYMRIL